MKTIWKWKLQPETTLRMPHGARVLAVQEQGGTLQLWALVDPGAETDNRMFRVYGTGETLPDEPGQHIGTIKFLGGALIFHVFETGTTLGHGDRGNQ